MATGFAVWITGLPASGKSTLARELANQLRAARLDPEVLDSDAVRQILTPRPTYRDEERDVFYEALAWMGETLVRHGVAVVFAATAPRRRHRDCARRGIPRFVEVFMDCPLELCMSRDPKGIYRLASTGQAATVPGVQASYEPPERPDLVVKSDREPPEAAATRIMDLLRARGYIASMSSSPIGNG